MADYKALVVDNDDESAKAAIKFLTSRGIKFDRACNLLEARNTLKLRRFGLLFLDLDLGGGSQEGVGLLAWMAEEKLEIPTVVVSRAAHTGPVIRAEKAYSFVKMRLTQNQLSDLADLLDSVIKDNGLVIVPSLGTRVTLALAGIILASLGGFLGLVFLKAFHEFAREAQLVLFVVLFAVVCALIQVFGAPLIQTAVEVVRKLAPVAKQLGLSRLTSPKKKPRELEEKNGGV